MLDVVAMGELIVNITCKQTNGGVTGHVPGLTGRKAAGLSPTRAVGISSIPEL